MNTTPETGCYVAGHWGQYGVARLVTIAADFGFDKRDVIELANKHLKSIHPTSNPDLTSDEFERLIDGADEAERWLNDNAVQPGYSWDWVEGEFFYAQIDEGYCRHCGSEIALDYDTGTWRHNDDQERCSVAGTYYDTNAQPEEM